MRVVPVTVIAAGVCTVPVLSRPLTWIFVAVSLADDETTSSVPAVGIS
jgi:hypothetical protein